MRIRTHIPGLNTQRHLQMTNRMLTNSLQRLSTGRRINSARDDASGLSISSGLEAQRRSHIRAIQNINDLSALIRTADSVLSNQVELVQRMRELALNASNGTLGATERKLLNTELVQLFSEYERIVEHAVLKEGSVFSSFSSHFKVLTGGSQNDRVEIEFANLQASNVFKKEIGTGNFNQASSANITANSHDAKFADVNGDGILDVISYTNATNKIDISLGQKDGGYIKQASVERFTRTSDIALEDYDGDGDIDILAVSTSSDGIQVYLNDGQGNFTQGEALESTVRLRSIAFGDLDGDGILDIVGLGQQGPGTVRIYSFLGRGDGRYQDVVTSDIATGGPLTYSHLIVQDFDGDKRDDLFFTAVTVLTDPAKIFTSNGDGTFSFGASLTMTSEITSIASSDFDGDGDLDIILGSANHFRIYENLGSNNYALKHTGQHGLTSVSKIEVGDLNADGIDDIILSGNKLSVLFGQEAWNSFSSPHILNYDGGIGIQVADHNKDEIPDLVWVGTHAISSLLALTQMVSGVQDLSISSQESAQNSLKILDNALNHLLKERSKLGSLENRLQSTLNSNFVLAENLARANSLITDLEFANELAEVSRLLILQQTEVAALSQNAIVLQAVLQLLD